MISIADMSISVTLLPSNVVTVVNADHLVAKKNLEEKDRRYSVGNISRVDSAM